MIKAEELVTFVTTDIAAITRGRAVAAADSARRSDQGRGMGAGEPVADPVR